MPVVYQVSVYEGRPEDEESWVPMKRQGLVAGASPLDAAKIVSKDLGYGDEPINKGLPSPSKERGWLFTQPNFGLIYEVESMSRWTNRKGFMTPKEVEELSSEYSPQERQRRW